LLYRVFIFISIFLSANAIAAVGKGDVSEEITNITSIISGILKRINANKAPEYRTRGRV
jgi:hypothetical protein